LFPILASKDVRKPAGAKNAGVSENASAVKNGDRFIQNIIGAITYNKGKSMEPELRTRNSIAERIPNMSAAIPYSSENIGSAAGKHRLNP
jgi:hypothetical protein